MRSSNKCNVLAAGGLVCLSDFRAGGRDEASLFLLRPGKHKVSASNPFVREVAGCVHAILFVGFCGDCCSDIPAAASAASAVFSRIFSISACAKVVIQMLYTNITHKRVPSGDRGGGPTGRALSGRLSVSERFHEVTYHLRGRPPDMHHTRMT